MLIRELREFEFKLSQRARTRRRARTRTREATWRVGDAHAIVAPQQHESRLSHARVWTRGAGRDTFPNDSTAYLSSRMSPDSRMRGFGRERRLGGKPDEVLEKGFRGS